MCRGSRTNWWLSVEQVRVRTGPRKLHLVTFNSVEQQPIRFDVQVAESVPVPAQGVIAVLRGQGIPLGQHRQRLAQLRHILAPFPDPSHIPAET